MSATSTSRAGSPTASPAALWSALVTVYLVWGSTYLGIALVVESMPPLLAMGLRFGTAGLIVVGIVAAVRGPRALLVPRAEIAGAAFGGVMLLGFGIGTLTLAERYVATGVAALIVAVVPLWIALLRVVAGDRPPVLTLLGVVVGIGGVALLVRPTGGLDGDAAARTLAWSLAIVGGSACWAVGSFLMPRMRTPRDPLVLTSYEMLAGGAALVLAGIVRGERAADLAAGTARSWAGWAYLVLVGSIVGYTAYLWLLDRAPISLVSTYAYVNPVVAVVLGAVVLGERLTIAVVAGGVVVLVGVALVVIAERTRRPAEPG